jgi:hypothetical protein
MSNASYNQRSKKLQLQKLERVIYLDPGRSHEEFREEADGDGSELHLLLDAGVENDVSESLWTE